MDKRPKGLAAVAARMKEAQAMSAEAVPTTVPEAPVPTEPTTPEAKPVTGKFAVGAKVKCGDLVGDVAEVMPAETCYKVAVGGQTYSLAESGLAEYTPAAPAQEDDNMNMDAVAKKLGLQPGATVDEINAQIDVLQGANTSAAAKLAQYRAETVSTALASAGCQSDMVDLLAGLVEGDTKEEIVASVATLKAGRPTPFVSQQVSKPQAPIGDEAIKALGKNQAGKAAASFDGGYIKVGG